MADKVFKGGPHTLGYLQASPEDAARVLAATIDAKTLIGLMWLREHVRRLAAEPPADDVA